MTVALADRRILVTGGGGFVGQHVVADLRRRGVREIHVPRRAEYDLTHEQDVERLFAQNGAEIVIHLAALVGGIGANRRQPGRFFYDNLVMGAMLMEYARRSGVQKFVGVGTVCAYPKIVPVPFREDDLWAGYPEETNAPYGLAKKMLLVQAQAYRQQYGFNAIYLLPVNLYGPGDNFDPDSAHVIPSMIRRCLEAVEQNASEIVCWGDGTATREFMYVEDCAEAIALATERYNDSDPVNIGSGVEVSISQLAERVARATAYSGRVRWDTTKPNGQPRRRVDTTRAERAFGFRATTDLDEGLRRTVEWYRRQRARHDGPRSPDQVKRATASSAFSNS